MLMTQFCNLENENPLGEINVETKITEKTLHVDIATCSALAMGLFLP